MLQIKGKKFLLDSKEGNNSYMNIERELTIRRVPLPVMKSYAKGSVSSDHEELCKGLCFLRSRRHATTSVSEIFIVFFEKPRTGETLF